MGPVEASHNLVGWTDDKESGTLPTGSGDEEVYERIRSYLNYRSRGLHPPAPLVETWERFYQDLAPRIRSFLGRCHLPESDRDDCAQEVWVWLIDHLARLRYDPRRGRLSTWMLTVARHKAVDRIRRNRHLITGLDEAGLPLTDPGLGPEDACERLWAQARVRTVLEELAARVPGRNYLVLHLRWIEGRTTAEIAEALGLTPEQVSFRHHRMKRKFRKLFERSRDVDVPADDPETDRPRPADRNGAQGMRRSCE